MYALIHVCCSWQGHRGFWSAHPRDSPVSSARPAHSVYCLLQCLLQLAAGTPLVYPGPPITQAYRRRISLSLCSFCCSGKVFPVSCNGWLTKLCLLLMEVGKKPELLLEMDTLLAGSLFLLLGMEMDPKLVGKLWTMCCCLALQVCCNICAW